MDGRIHGWNATYAALDRDTTKGPTSLSVTDEEEDNEWPDDEGKEDTAEDGGNWEQPPLSSGDKIKLPPN